MAVTRADGVHFDAKNAGADLSSALMLLAHVDTDGDVVLAGAGDVVMGVITEEAVQGKPVTVQIGGLAKAKAGAAITAGESVMSNGDGKAITATAGNPVLGVARNSVTAEDEIVEIQIDRSALET